MSRPGGRLYSIDLPYLLLRNDAWVGEAVPPELRRSWEVLRMADRKGVPRVLEEVEALDLVHYDSDKTYSGRMWTYRRIWPVLRSGAPLMSDDVGDNLAFRDFVEEVGGEPLVVADPGGEKFQGLVRKPPCT